MRHLLAGPHACADPFVDVLFFIICSSQSGHLEGGDENESIQSEWGRWIVLSLLCFRLGRPREEVGWGGQLYLRHWSIHLEGMGPSLP